MKQVKWMILVFSLFFFTGCYNYREITQIALTSAIGIDKTEDGKEYKITIQILNTQKQGSDNSSGGDQPKFILYTSKGATIQEALRKTIFDSPRRLYANHMSLLLISEKVAKEGIEDLLDFFARNTEARKQFLVVISREANPSDVMQVLTPLDSLNAQNIHDSIIADTKFYGMSTKTTFEDLLKTYLNDRTNIVLPSIESVGNAKKGDDSENIKQSIPDTTVMVKPLAIFKGEKLVGYLTDEESRAYNYIAGNIATSIITCNCGDNGIFTAEIVSTKTKLKSNIKERKISIAIKAKSNIKEINCDMNLLEPSAIDQLEGIISHHMKEMISNVITNTFDTYHTDIFGFEELLYKTSPIEYQKLKQQYQDKLLDEFHFDVDVDVKVQAKGNIIKEITR